MGNAAANGVPPLPVTGPAAVTGHAAMTETAARAETAARPTPRMGPLPWQAARPRRREPQPRRTRRHRRRRRCRFHHHRHRQRRHLHHCCRCRRQPTGTEGGTARLTSYRGDPVGAAAASASAIAATFDADALKRPTQTERTAATARMASSAATATATTRHHHNRHRYYPLHRRHCAARACRGGCNGDVASSATALGRAHLTPAAAFPTRIADSWGGGVAVPAARAVMVGGLSGVGLPRPLRHRQPPRRPPLPKRRATVARTRSHCRWGGRGPWATK